MLSFTRREQQELTPGGRGVAKVGRVNTNNQLTKSIGMGGGRHKEGKEEPQGLLGKVQRERKQI